MWTLYKALFDQMNSDRWDTGWPQDAMNLSSLIDNSIKVDAITHKIMIYVGVPFPDFAFKEILCHTCCSIVSEQYSQSIGCWNGQLYEDTNSNGFPDWFEAPPLGVRRQLSPYDTGSKPIFVGTGPYCVSVYSSALTSVSLTRNTNYWKGWPAAGCNSSVDSIMIDYSAWMNPPLDGLSDGSYDIRDVPRPYIFTYLTSTKNVKSSYPYLKTISKINPVLGLDSLVFNYAVDSSSPYIGTGHFPDGIPTDFFGNPTAGLNIRKAFANALNHSLYLHESFFDEGQCRETPAISGLYPDYYNKGPDPPWTYDENLTNANTNLTAATAWGGGSVWTQGFTFDIAYASGDDEAKIACEMIKDFFVTLSTFTARIGPPFVVNVRSLNLDVLLKEFEAGTLPICVMPWHGDYADSDAFFRTFMHSDGYIARFQSYTSTTTGTGTGKTKDALIDQALKTNPGPAQQILYNDLQDIYITDVPSIPIVQPTGRKWMQYWVKGWYYNPLYPGDYYYTMWKADDCWFDITGPTKAVSDGIVNMRDIAYLIMHFNARAPVPGLPVDPKWVGVYGANGCVDPYGDRKSDMRDIALCIQHFNHKNNTQTP